MLKTTAMIILLKTYFGMHCLNMSDSHWNSSSLQVELWSTFSKSVLLNKSSFIIKSSFLQAAHLCLQCHKGQAQDYTFYQAQQVRLKKTNEKLWKIKFSYSRFSSPWRTLKYGWVPVNRKWSTVISDVKCETVKKQNKKKKEIFIFKTLLKLSEDKSKLLCFFQTIL